jgi:hypothetical protein
MVEPQDWGRLVQRRITTRAGPAGSARCERIYEDERTAQAPCTISSTDSPADWRMGPWPRSRAQSRQDAPQAQGEGFRRTEVPGGPYSSGPAGCVGAHEAGRIPQRAPGRHCGGHRAKRHRSWEIQKVTGGTPDAPRRDRACRLIKTQIWKNSPSQLPLGASLRNNGTIRPFNPS